MSDFYCIKILVLRYLKCTVYKANQYLKIIIALSVGIIFDYDVTLAVKQGPSVTR